MGIKIDASYLRYIHDGIHSGSIHAENASSLPEGLNGMYEDAFLGAFNVAQSQKQLKRFAFFSLLKKEVSAKFVSIVLDDPEPEIKDFISLFSKWFNVANADKYELYHERLKSFLLNKVSNNEVVRINNLIIHAIKQSLQKKSADELEMYGLEFLTSHYLIDAHDTINGKNIIDFAISELTWKRQVELSNSYRWSNRTIGTAMLWSSKYDNQSYLDSYFASVRLHYLEQNDSENIIGLLRNRNIDLVSDRIVALGDISKLGRSRQFLVYLLCLIELNQMPNEDIAWVKESANKLINQLKNEIPVDYSVLDWSNFIPSGLVVKLTMELIKKNIDASHLFAYTSKLDRFGINISDAYNSNQIKYLFETIKNLKSYSSRCLCLSELLIFEINNNKSIEINNRINLMFDYLNNIEDEENNHKTAFILYDEWKVFQDYNISNRFLECSINSARNIQNATQRNQAFKNLCVAIYKKKDLSLFNEIFSLITNSYWRGTTYMELASVCKDLSDESGFEKNMNEAKLCFDAINNDSVQSEAYHDLSILYAKKNDLVKSENILKEIKSDYWRSIGYNKLSMCLMDAGKEDEAILKLDKSFEEASKIKRDAIKNEAYMELAASFYFFNQVDKSNRIIENISSEFWKSCSLINLAVLFRNKGMVSETIFFLDVATKTAPNVLNPVHYSELLFKIINEYCEIDHLTTAIQLISLISELDWKEKTLKLILNHQLKNNKSDCFSNTIFTFIKYETPEKVNAKKIELLDEIADDFIFEKKTDEAKYFVINNFSEQVFCKKMIRKLEWVYEKGFIEEAKSIERVIIDNSYKIRDNSKRGELLYDLIVVLAKNSEFENLKDIVKLIYSDFWKAKSYAVWAIELYNNKFSNEILLDVFNLAIFSAENIQNESHRNEMYAEISSFLLSANQTGISKSVYGKITSNYWKSYALSRHSKHFSFSDNPRELDLHVNSVFEKINQIQNISLQGDAINKLCIILSSFINFKIAFAIARQIQDKEWHDITLYELYEIFDTRLTEAMRKELFETFYFENYRNKIIEFDSIKYCHSKKLSFYKLYTMISQISSGDKRMLCWIKAGEVIYELKGFSKCNKILDKFKDSKAKYYFIMGMVRKQSIKSITFSKLKPLLWISTNNYDSIELLLNKYLLNRIIYHNEIKENTENKNHFKWIQNIKIFST